MPIIFRVKIEEDKNDRTAPYYEFEAFNSIWDALRWKHVRKRVPICFKKSLHNRYMIPSLIYLGYTIAFLIIDFHPDFIVESDINATTETSGVILDQPVVTDEYVNNVYIGLAVVNILVTFLYLIAWRGRSWSDIVVIPEYLNHVQGGLYLWSAIWYSKQDTLGGYYTMAVHRIELAASCIEVCAAIGWMISWYRTYTRALGRGFTLDDPDTIAYLTTTTNTFIYLVYNIQINVYPEEYGINQIYLYADILGFIGSIYYIFGTLRDDNWFWFLPLAGQYRIAAGRIHIDGTRALPKFGKPEMRIFDLCRQRNHNKQTDNHVDTNIMTTYF